MRRCSGQSTRNSPPKDQKPCPPRPPSGCWSTSTTRRPAAASSAVATSPASPAPTTMTSASIRSSSRWRPQHRRSQASRSRRQGRPARVTGTPRSLFGRRARQYDSPVHERAPSRGVAPVRAQRPAREARPAPTPAQRVLAYQRAVGNATVSRWLSGAAGPIVARDAPPALAPVAPPVPRISYVFLMGDVKRDSFYLAAREYFSHMVKGAVIVTDKRTLAEVIDHVNAGGRPVDTLYVVSHANESGNLGFSMDAADLARDRARADRKPRTEFSEV